MANVKRGVRVPTSPLRDGLPLKPKRQVLLTMSPHALRRIMREWYLRGVADTDRQYNGDRLKLENRTVQNLFVARFDHLYNTRQGG